MVLSTIGGGGAGMGGDNLPIWLDILHIIWRTVVLTLVVLVAVRVMGKRSVSNMAPFDLAVIIIMGSAAAIPMEEHTRLIHGIVPIFVMASIQWMLAWVNVRYRNIERVTQGVSTILVKDGRIMHDNLRKERVSLADLWLNLREQGITSLSDVQQATLEPDGRVSVIKTRAASPLTPKDVYKLTLSRTDALAEEAMVRFRNRLEDLIQRNRRRV